jgi:hypothetical protein
MKRVLPDSQQSLVQWVSQATGISTFGVKIRLQGNDLHILCEGSECPQRWRTLSDLLQALQHTNVDILTSSGRISIYQVFVYGRKKGENRAKWCHRVYLNQLERHLQQVNSALIQDAEKSATRGGALIISNESLARQGHPDAIARYLSETLSTLGVSVNVKVRKQTPASNNQNLPDRLWIFCQSSYSPDVSLIAEVVAKELRELKLSGYQDAVIAFQVNGENTPDWVLRIDLTPPEVMLKEWARWGDLQAITRLLTEAFSASKVAVETTLKESTLHIFCTPAQDVLENASVPEKSLCLEIITPLVEAIAPQSILQATVYGQKIGDNQPAWIDWLSLPANEHEALAPSPLELAVSGDEEALIFLLERLLNPDLDLRLVTGGIRVLLLCKGDLLHIMCDAPTCPGRQQVASTVTDFISQLKIPEIKGVRVYGRRAGNKEPFWHDGVDFEHRQHLVPEAIPEFAAASIYMRDLLPSEMSAPMLRPDVTHEEIPTLVLELAQDWKTTLRNLLVGTQVFVESQQPSPAIRNGQDFLVALVWGTLGLLLTLQTDWVLGRMTTQTMKSKPTPVSVLPQSSNKKTGALTNSSPVKSSGDQSFVFNASEFTQIDDPDIKGLAAAPLKQKATSTAILLAARAQIPSFNTRQLEEQLALYKQRLLKRGKPPNVLIIGSSRALRGVDPAELSQALATQGYLNVDVFNFGINGATSKVVDFVLRQVLQPSELPKLIIWADGSRAFNSGRDDITFNAIAASQGYKEISSKALSKINHADLLTPTQIATVEKTKNSYHAFNRWLNHALAKVSATYQNRDTLNNLLLQQLKSWSTMGNSFPAKSTKADQEDENSLQSVDFDGFLPLSIRFQPQIYYQQHPKVTGDYDNDYKNFQLGGEQDAALQAVIEFTKTHNISLVFVNMPLTADYLDPVRSKYEQEFHEYMLRLANQPNFIYRDFTHLWITTIDYFSDPSHLNRYGAYEVSKKLAHDTMIPWPSK